MTDRPNHRAVQMLACTTSDALRKLWAEMTTEERHRFADLKDILKSSLEAKGK